MAAATTLKSEQDHSRHFYMWIVLAKKAIAQYVLSPRANSRDLQTLVWLIFLSYIYEDCTMVWVLSGIAWRMACALGYNCLDSPANDSCAGPAENFGNIFKEQVRKTMWSLFIFDSGLLCLTRGANMLNDPHFPL